MNTEALISIIEKTDSYKRFGKVTRVVGLMIESEGPAANIGEVCYIHTSTNDGNLILAEVVGFQNEKKLF